MDGSPSPFFMFLLKGQITMNRQLYRLRCKRNFNVFQLTLYTFHSDPARKKAAGSTRSTLP